MASWSAAKLPPGVAEVVAWGVFSMPGLPPGVSRAVAAAWVYRGLGWRRRRRSALSPRMGGGCALPFPFHPLRAAGAGVAAQISWPLEIHC